jgi:hypothetical protein
MAIFNSFLYVYQRVWTPAIGRSDSTKIPGGLGENRLGTGPLGIAEKRKKLYDLRLNFLTHFIHSENYAHILYMNNIYI